MQCLPVIVYCHNHKLYLQNVSFLILTRSIRNAKSGSVSKMQTDIAIYCACPLITASAELFGQSPFWNGAINTDKNKYNWFVEILMMNSRQCYDVLTGLGIPCCFYTSSCLAQNISLVMVVVGQGNSVKAEQVLRGGGHRCSGSMASFRLYFEWQV